MINLMMLSVSLVYLTTGTSIGKNVEKATMSCFEVPFILKDSGNDEGTAIRLVGVLDGV